jgi:hypothetical protein
MAGGHSRPFGFGSPLPQQKLIHEGRDLGSKGIYTPFNSWGRTHICQAGNETRQQMWRLIKAVFYLVVLCAVALVAYAYLGPLFFPADFAAPAEEVTRPVTLDAN